MPFNLYTYYYVILLHADPVLGAVQNPETQNPDRLKIPILEIPNPKSRQVQNPDRYKIPKNWPALSFNAARN
jgi:hypothetical protein